MKRKATEHRNVYLVDTTLRDGNQSPDCNFDVDTKKKFALLLDEIGYYQIEAGIPAAGKEEKDFLCRLMSEKKHAKVATWNRMNKQDIAHSFDCAPDVIHISAPVSDGMIQSILHKDRKWLETELLRCVEFASGKGYEVTVGFQDESRADPDFMLKLASALKDFNICALRLADTVGILTPRATAELVGRFMIETEFAIGVHTHNDLGMAVATATEAVKFGAVFVDVTMFGVGERAGNCDAFQFSHAMQPFYHIAPSFEKLTDQRARISELMKHVCKKNGWLTS